MHRGQKRRYRKGCERSFVMKNFFYYLIVIVLFFAAGCSKKAALAYVQPGAQIVAYGNTTELLKKRLWKNYEKSVDFQKAIGSFLAAANLTTADLSGKIALWKNGQSTSNMMAVFVSEKPVELLFEKLRTAATVSFGDFQGKQCAVLHVFNICFIMLDKNTIQISLGEPVELLKPSSRSKLANSLDSNALFGIVVSDGAMREYLQDYQGELPAISQFMIRANDDKISVEASWDVSNMDDISGLFETLMPKLQ